MALMYFRVSGFDGCCSNELRCSARVLLHGGENFLNARAAVTAVDNRERTIVFEKALYPKLRTHPFDVDSSRPSGRRAGHSYINPVPYQYLFVRMDSSE